MGSLPPCPWLKHSGSSLGSSPHPMYADDRSAINTLATANDVCDELNHPLVGIAFDVTIYGGIQN